ncbi:MAG: cysteine desulfurase [Thermoanaerobaculia bacterium]|nr:cysteine desulfurase [Thermoanaerobaculia bacterium]
MDGYTYFDNNATTPLDSRVAEAMIPWLTTQHGNASSLHRVGRLARGAVDRARMSVAKTIGAEPLDIIFTGSGTEANNAVIFEVTRAAGHRGELVVSAIEHPSVLRAAECCAAAGMTLHKVAPGRDGVVSAQSMMDRLNDDTKLVCLMMANNELGTLQPVADVARACRERGILMLCDAVQGVGKLEVDVEALGVDFLTLGGHKFHGPLGAAALWVRPGTHFEGWVKGGSQERQLRAGTVNVSAIVGLGKACDLIRDELELRCEHLLGLRNYFEGRLAEIPGACLHCCDAPRLPHTSNVAFEGLVGSELMMRLDAAGFAVSTGSACGSGQDHASSTVLALGIDPEMAAGSIRISFGMTNTLHEVETFLDALAVETAALRSAASA